MDIVAARRNAMMDSTSTKSFAHLSQAGNISRYMLNLEKGDLVRAMVEDKVMECEVTSVSDNEVKLSCGGKSMTLPKHAVLEVVKKHHDVDASRKKMEEDYYTKAYGDPGYAAEMVKK